MNKSTKCLTSTKVFVKREELFSPSKKIRIFFRYNIIMSLYFLLLIDSFLKWEEVSRRNKSNIYIIIDLLGIS